MKVLIVDDSTAVREKLGTLLSKTTEAQNINYAEDVPGAIRSVQELNPDVVILDVHILGGSGMDVLREIKKVDRSPLSIVLTNYPYPQYRRKYIDAGADFFFDKSTEFDKVAVMLRRLNENQSREYSRPRVEG